MYSKNELKYLIQEAVEEGMKDTLKKGGKKVSSAIKKGWKKYNDWCQDGLKAENPSQIDFKEYSKETMRNIGSKIKDGWNKYCDWCDKNLEDDVNESLRRFIKESVRQVLRENEDEFTPHAFKGTSNYGGNELQISDGGDMARLRDSHTGSVTDWMEIEFDADGVAYVIDEDGNEERLCDYMRC